jgi:plastocyanin
MTLFGPPCSAPEAVGSPRIEVSGSPTAPVTASDVLRLSWKEPAAGSPPGLYEYRLNGDPWARTPDTFVDGVVPRGRLDPITLHVRAVGCTPEETGPEAASPTYSLAPPVASFRASRTTVAVGEPVSFTDTSSPQATAWFWFFGDGGFATGQNPQHTFATSGTFGVQLVAVNGSGASVSPIQLITVNPSALARAEASGRVWFAGKKAARHEFRSDGRGTLALESGEESTVYVRLVRGGDLVLERRVVLGACEEARLDLAAYLEKLPGAVGVEVVADRPVAAALEDEVRR